MKLHSEVIFNRKKKDPAKETLYCLLAGIVIIGLIEELILFFILYSVAAALGILLGIWVSVINSVYIYRSLSRALELDEKDSVRAMRGPVLIRYCFMGIAVAVSLLYPKIFSPVGTILGLLSMKLSAYVQPFFFRKNYAKEDAQPILEEEESPDIWGFGVFHTQQEGIEEDK